MTIHVAVAAWLDDGRPSGATRRLRGLLGAVATAPSTDVDITVLVGVDDPGGWPEGMHVRTVAIPRGSAWRRARAEQRRLPGVLAGLRVDVLDLQSLPVPHGLPCPVVLTVHDLRDLGPEPRRPRWLARAVLRAAVARSRTIVVPSHHTAGALRAATGIDDDRVVVIPNAVDAPATDVAPAPPCVLHVGHLERRKNLVLLIRAHAALGPQAPPLVLAGADHGDGARLRRLVRTLGDPDRVRFLGRVSEDTLHALYRGARVVAVPSRCEGFGLAALEGLAAGKPVLVSDAGALPEVVGDAATVLPCDDVGAWTVALRRTLSEPANENATVHRRARAAAFSWDAAATATLAVWGAAAVAR